MLQGIYKKNKEGALKEKHITNSNLLSILTKPETLLLAYREIKGNKGAMTKSATASISKEDFNNLTDSQKILYEKSFTFPDGINIHTIRLACRLLSKNKYPWGTSLRIYIDKPGQQKKKRPLTIPPFMDRLVQKAIELILHAIYEPDFEKTNRSFGFRPNKGTHDAIIPLLSGKCSGMKTAIKGDVEAAYDTVQKQTLLKILSKKIVDRKFLKLIEQRLNYEYLDKITNERTKPKQGIPQGGTDSPYLFNIYMNELDQYVHNDLQKDIDQLNQKYISNHTSDCLTHKNEDPVYHRHWNPRFAKLKIERISLLRKLKKQKKETNYKSNADTYSIVKKIRLNQHYKNRVSSSTNNKRILRILYIRYADDWIIVTNGNKEIGNLIKKKITEFLLKNLYLKLSEKKTLVTNITREPARFLGFEIRASKFGPLRKEATKKSENTMNENGKKHITCKVASTLLWVQPDRLRLINRQYMKGFCNKNGFPISIPWISCFEAQTIIERYNTIIRGLSEYYLPVIRNPSKIHRWIYILRFSCLKTLAQKYKLSISKIFKKYGHNMYNKSDQTINVWIKINHKEKVYKKNWSLHTYKNILKLVQYKETKSKLMRTFWDKERQIIGDYPLKKGKVPKVTNEDYLEKLTWVSWRTSALLDMPCAYCGNSEDVHQHHLNHVRKTAYTLIPNEQSYKQILALRNRKQIPLCQICHQKLVHAGKYDGPKLRNFTIKIIDNRIITPESFIHPGYEHHTKSLEEKGWTDITKNLIKPYKRQPPQSDNESQTKRKLFD